MPPQFISVLWSVISLGDLQVQLLHTGLVADGNWKNALVAVVTFLIAAFINTKGKGFLRIIPFLFAIIGGYLFALTLGLVDFIPVLKAIRFDIFGFYTCHLAQGVPLKSTIYFCPEAIAILPIAIVTISENIGETIVLGQICGRVNSKEHRLHRTLLGDGISQLLSAFLCGDQPIQLTEKIQGLSVWLVSLLSQLCNSAFSSRLPSASCKFSLPCSFIPQTLLGGMSILLYGVIASNVVWVSWLKHVLISLKWNLSSSRAICWFLLLEDIFKLGP